MKGLNKESIRKIVMPGIVIIIIIMAVFLKINITEYDNYKKITNATISSIVDEVLKKYPETNEEEIIKILNAKEEIKEAFMNKYGYTEDMQYVNRLEKLMKTSIIINLSCIAVFGMIFIIFYLRYSRKQNSEIADISSYLNEINNKNYLLKIEENNDDELSKLRNELYKTTVLLKETAENSEKEKIQLENSLADISHQLKTPLTSIRIMLDNIYENPEMDEKTRTEFIEEISKQTEWMSSLIITLLKLAKFDSGTIIMKDDEINVKELLEKLVSNLSVMLDIKNIEILVNVDKDITFIADYKWQLEALTNIVKNAIEHSNNDSKIYIDVENSSVFLKVKIRDEGEGIDENDIKHIFERFYKAKKSGENSVGIGLSLAKTIIEKDNGYIKVDSKKNEGTTFEIKYLK